MQACLGGLAAIRAARAQYAAQKLQERLVCNASRDEDQQRQPGNTCKGYVNLLWGCLIDMLGQGRLIQRQIITAFDICVVEGDCHWSFWHIAQQSLPLSLEGSAEGTSLALLKGQNI